MGCSMVFSSFHRGGLVRTCRVMETALSAGVYDPGAGGDFAEASSAFPGFGGAGAMLDVIFASNSAIVAGGRMPTICRTSLTAISADQLATAAHLCRKPERT